MGNEKRAEIKGLIAQTEKLKEQSEKSEYLIVYDTVVQKKSQKNNRYTTKADAEKVKAALECCAMARHNPAFCEQCPYHDKNDKDSICVYQGCHFCY